jgi:hypothetical protein
LSRIRQAELARCTHYSMLRKPGDVAAFNPIRQSA